MAGKRALVTGAGKRLGRAMALSLARNGHHVAVHYFGSEADAENTAEEIAEMGQKVCLLKADLLKENETEKLVSAASAELGGPLNVLINNASIFENDDIATGDRDSWDRHIESNLRAPVVLTQKFAQSAPAPLLDANGEKLARAMVINMLDQRVRKLTPNFMSYSIAKMGLWAFTQTAARALAPAVRVNAIGPGPTMRGSRQSEDHFAKQRAATVLQRGSNPEDVVAAMEYFLSAPAVTGQLICVDGGQHLAWQTPDILGLE